MPFVGLPLTPPALARLPGQQRAQLFLCASLRRRQLLHLRDEQFDALFCPRLRSREVALGGREILDALLSAQLGGRELRDDGGQLLQLVFDASDARGQLHKLLTLYRYADRHRMPRIGVHARKVRDTTLSSRATVLATIRPPSRATPHPHTLHLAAVKAPLAAFPHRRSHTPPHTWPFRPAAAAQHGLYSIPPSARPDHDDVSVFRHFTSLPLAAPTPSSARLVELSHTVSHPHLETSTRRPGMTAHHRHIDCRAVPRIGINARKLGDAGVDPYAQSLLAGLAKIDGAAAISWTVYSQYPYCHAPFSSHHAQFAKCPLCHVYGRT